MAPALTVGLNGLGICWNLPHKLVYGPVEKQGLGLPHLRSLKGIVHVEDLILRTCLESLAGEMFAANLEQMIVDVGVGAEVLQTLMQDYGFLTPYTWMAHLWEFLEDSKLGLKHDIEVPLCCCHDQFLMPAFRRYFTKSQLQAINRC
jgi:hypothetical protein